MKRIYNIITGAGLLFAMLLPCSCDTPIEETGFGVDETSLSYPETGGTRKVRVAAPAGSDWIASTTESWIMVSPTNGRAGTVCDIKVDSSFLYTGRTGKVTFSTAGFEHNIDISQDGFKKIISVPENQQTFKLPDFAPYGETFFEVDVKANVPFKLSLEAKDENGEWTGDNQYTSWLTPKTFKQDLENKAKPRTVKLRFDWMLNTRPNDKEVRISFLPTEADDQDTEVDRVSVVQAAAPEITPDRRGDSLALIAIHRSLSVWGTYWDTSQSMIYWEGVELFPDNYKEPEKRGRVRSLELVFFDTRTSLPYEIQYLKPLESLRIYSNTNSMFKTGLRIGEYVNQLTNLKSLTIGAYGLEGVYEGELDALDNLETLDLNSNCFKSLEEVCKVVNRENFPKLKHLNMSTNRRKDNIADLSAVADGEDIGMRGPIPASLFNWPELETLVLSYNYLEGTVPAMDDLVSEKWTLEDLASDEYKDVDEITKRELVGEPKVLPHIKTFSINLNKLTGELPKWLQYHPNICWWAPEILVFNQEGRDSKGKMSGFTNIRKDLPCYVDDTVIEGDGTLR